MAQRSITTLTCEQRLFATAVKFLEFNGIPIETKAGALRSILKVFVDSIGEQAPECIFLTEETAKAYLRSLNFASDTDVKTNLKLTITKPAPADLATSFENADFSKLLDEERINYE